MTSNQNNPVDSNKKNNATGATPRQKKFPLWKNVIAMVVVLALFIGGGYWASVIYTRHGEEVTIPDLSGLSVEQADEKLGALGLFCQVQDSAYDQSMANGLICAQSLSPGNKVKPGRTIYLTINSDMADRLTLPDIADNSSFREASARLTTMGFTLGAPEYVDGERDWVYAVKCDGRTISAGAKVKLTTPLTLVIGRGYSYSEEEMVSGDSLSMDEEILELF